MAATSSESNLTLYVFPGNEYSASIDPESLQILTYLRLLGDHSVRVISTCKHWQSPTGIFPTLVVSEGATLTGVDRIIRELKRQGLDLDKDRNEGESAEIIAFSAFLTDRLKLPLLYIHWVDGKNYTEVTRKWFSGMVHFPLTLYILSRQHRLAKQTITTSLPTITTPDQQGLELINQGEEALDSLTARLGDKEYFFGRSPSTLDALVFGYLDLIAQYWLPGNNQLRSKLVSHSQLFQFCSRLRSLAFPELKSRSVSMATVSQPSVPLYRDPVVWFCVGVAGVLLLVQGVRVGLATRIANKWAGSMGGARNKKSRRNALYGR